MDLDALEALTARLAARAREAQAKEHDEAERRAEEEWRHSYVPLPDRERAARAMALLRGFSASDEDVRAIGLWRARPGDWPAEVERLLSDLDPACVVDLWLEEHEAGRDGAPLRPVAVAALARLPSLEPFATRLRRLLVAPAHGNCRWRLEEVLRHSPAALHPEVLALVDELLDSDDREAASSAIRVAGALAGASQQAPARVAAARVAAARVALAARADRRRRIDDQRVAPRALAEAVRLSRCPALTPTAMLELDAADRTHRCVWAVALGAVAGDAGVAHLLARRHAAEWSDAFVAVATRGGAATEAFRRSLLDDPDPEVRLAAARACPERTQRHLELAAVGASLDRVGGWAALERERESLLRELDPQRRSDDWDELARGQGEPLRLAELPSPLEAVTSPIADLRRRAVENLAAAPRREHLQALLLALDLDRQLARRVYREPWQPPELAHWVPLLQQRLENPRPMDRWIARAAELGDSLAPEARLFLEQLAVLRGRDLVERLLDAGVAATAIHLPPPQRSTPALDELRVLGAARYAERLPPPHRLTDAERSALEAAEEALIRL